MDLLFVNLARILLIVGAWEVIGSVAGRGLVSQGLNLAGWMAFSQPESQWIGNGAIGAGPTRAKQRRHGRWTRQGMRTPGGIILLFNGVVLQTRSRWPTVFGRFPCRWPIAFSIGILRYRLLIGAGLSNTA